MVRHASTSWENLGNHPVRRQILDALKRTPGASISWVCQEAGHKWGTIQHHLRLLERANKIFGIKQGRARHYFIRGHVDALAGAIAVLRRGRTAELANRILDSPGCLQQDLVSALRMTRKVMREYLDRLVAEGLIREAAASGTRRYFPMPRLVEALRAMRAC